jgi:hemolysin III
MRVATGFTQYRGGELAADRIVHTIGNFAGVVGSVMLMGIAAGIAERPIFLASLVYSICLLTMLGCSAAYNLTSDPEKRFSASLIMPQSS